MDQESVVSLGPCPAMWVVCVSIGVFLSAIFCPLPCPEGQDTQAGRETLQSMTKASDTHLNAMPLHMWDVFLGFSRATGLRRVVTRPTARSALKYCFLANGEIFSCIRQMLIHTSGQYVSLCTGHVFGLLTSNWIAQGCDKTHGQICPQVLLPCEW